MPARNEAPDYAAMSPGDCYTAMGADAAKYADFFCQLNPDADWGLMMGWFANAMCAQHDFGGNLGKLTVLPDGSAMLS